MAWIIQIQDSEIAIVMLIAQDSIYGSVSAGREKSLFRVTFFYGEPSCGQIMQNKIDFLIDFG